MDVKDLKIIFLPTKIYKVDARLLRGNAVFSPVKAMRLKHNNVNRVIDLRNKEKKATLLLKKMEEFYCKLFGIKYENMTCYISTTSVPEQDFFNQLNRKIIENKGGKTYLHCHYGNHRTNMCVAMYEKSIGKSNNNIIKDLLQNFWKNDGEKERLYSKNKKSLDIFLDKYF